jgi:lipoprotein-releasing system permease protein
VGLAVAIGIASVLVVSVSQRSREIGILRAMGLSRLRVQRVFLIQGALLGLVGATFGSAMGAGLVKLFTMFAVTAERSFPIVVSLALVTGVSTVATVTSLVAASYPARRAARLDPVVAIRNV